MAASFPYMRFCHRNSFNCSIAALDYENVTRSLLLNVRVASGKKQSAHELMAHVHYRREQESESKSSHQRASQMVRVPAGDVGVLTKKRLIMTDMLPTCYYIIFYCAQVQQPI